MANAKGLGRPLERQCWVGGGRCNNEERNAQEQRETDSAVTVSYSPFWPEALGHGPCTRARRRLCSRDMTRWVGRILPAAVAVVAVALCLGLSPLLRPLARRAASAIDPSIRVRAVRLLPTIAVDLRVPSIGAHHAVAPARARARRRPRRPRRRRAPRARAPPRARTRRRCSPRPRGRPAADRDGVAARARRLRPAPGGGARAAARRQPAPGEREPGRERRRNRRRRRDRQRQRNRRRNRRRRRRRRRFRAARARAGALRGGWRARAPSSRRGDADAGALAPPATTVDAPSPRAARPAAADPAAAPPPPRGGGGAADPPPPPRPLLEWAAARLVANGTHFLPARDARAAGAPGRRRARLAYEIASGASAVRLGVPPPPRAGERGGATSPPAAATRPR